MTFVIDIGLFYCMDQLQLILVQYWRTLNCTQFKILQRILLWTCIFIYDYEYIFCCTAAWVCLRGSSACWSLDNFKVIEDLRVSIHIWYMISIFTTWKLNMIIKIFMHSFEIKINSPYVDINSKFYENLIIFCKAAVPFCWEYWIYFI